MRYLIYALWVRYPTLAALAVFYAGAMFGGALLLWRLAAHTH